MRKTLLIVTLFALFLMFGFSATALAFVEISPFHAGQTFFPVQNSLDHAHKYFIWTQPVNRIMKWIYWKSGLAT